MPPFARIRGASPHVGLGRPFTFLGKRFTFDDSGEN